MHPNVTAALEKARIPYTVHRHVDLPIIVRSPQDFANALGYELNRITKTLFLRCDQDNKYVIVVASTGRKVNLSLIANHMGCKRVQIASREELLATVGYPPTGVSPIGIGAIPVFIDANLFEFETVLVGAGAAGVEVEIAPSHLRDITQAEVLSLAS